MIMLECWEYEPDTRPTFAAIVESLSLLLETMVGYMDIGTLADGEILLDCSTTAAVEMNDSSATVLKNATFIELETIAEEIDTIDT